MIYDQNKKNINNEKKLKKFSHAVFKIKMYFFFGCDSAVGFIILTNLSRCIKEENTTFTYANTFDTYKR